MFLSSVYSSFLVFPSFFLQLKTSSKERGGSIQNTCAASGTGQRVTWTGQRPEKDALTTDESLTSLMKLSSHQFLTFRPSILWVSSWNTTAAAAKYSRWTLALIFLWTQIHIYTLLIMLHKYYLCTETRILLRFQVFMYCKFLLWLFDLSEKTLNIWSFIFDACVKENYK